MIGMNLTICIENRGFFPESYISETRKDIVDTLRCLEFVTLTMNEAETKY